MLIFWRSISSQMCHVTCSSFFKFHRGQTKNHRRWSRCLIEGPYLAFSKLEKARRKISWDGFVLLQFSVKHEMSGSEEPAVCACVSCSDLSLSLSLSLWPVSSLKGQKPDKLTPASSHARWRTTSRCQHQWISKKTIKIPNVAWRSRLPYTECQLA